MHHASIQWLLIQNSPEMVEILTASFDVSGLEATIPDLLEAPKQRRPSF